MKNIALFINNTHADIEDLEKFIEQFKLTLSFSDLENPADIKDEYSYSVDLPGTPTNSEIFGKIDTGVSSWVDIFNPSVPVDYFVTVNGSVWRRGKCRLTGITVNSGRRTFKVCFYGRLAATFYDMKRTLLKDSSMFSDNRLEHTLDISTLYSIWNSDGEDTLKYVPMQQGLYPNFDSKKIISANSLHITEDNPNGVFTIDMSDDMSEYMMSEYRVQYQRPALSMSALLRGIASEYGITLSQGIFESRNPYFDKLYLVSGQYSVEETITGVNGTFQEVSDRSAQDLQITIPAEPVSVGSDDIFDNDIIVGDNPYTLTLECLVNMTANFNWNDDFFNKYRNLYSEKMHTDGITFNAVLRYGSETITSDNSVTIQEDPTWKLTTYDSDYAHFTIVNGDMNPEPTDYGIPMSFTFHLPLSAANKTYRLRLNITGNDDMMFTTSPNKTTHEYMANSITYTVKPTDTLPARIRDIIHENGYTGMPLKYEVNEVMRSGSKVNIDNILSESISQGDIMLGYTKMFGCIWDSDAEGNISVMSRNEFFNGYQVFDWTYKLDRSQDINIEPLTFDKYKYVFKHDDGKSYLEEEYETSFGEVYGSKNVYPGYSFSSDEQEVLDTIFMNTVMGDMSRRFLENDSSWYSAASYPLPCIYKENQTNNKGGYRLMFNTGYSEMGDKTPVYITEDSSYMLSDDYGGKPCWVSHTASLFSGNRHIVTDVPHFDTRYEMCSLDFAKPKVSYNHESDTTYRPEYCIYPRFWEKYISEIYSINNRKMTAWFRLDDEDIRNFSFRNFVTVDHKLWHPVKLYSVSPLGDSLTKVDLVEVQDISAYTSGQDIPEIRNN